MCRQYFILNARRQLVCINNYRSSEKTVKQLISVQVEKVFVASDGSDEEMDELKKLVPQMVMYRPTSAVEKRLKKGGVAIVDQIICSHARYLCYLLISLNYSRYPPDYITIPFPDKPYLDNLPPSQGKLKIDGELTKSSNTFTNYKYSLLYVLHFCTMKSG